MLFNSYIFIFLFLPVVLAGFYLIGGRGHHRIAVAWLVASSLIFYGAWNPVYLLLIIISVLFNYALGITLTTESQNNKKLLLAMGVGANLGLLAYFKYANFFVNNFNYIFDASITLDKILLPLAISFFTFQQIAYLVDAARGETREYNFLHYCLFVLFFPQLIAGPIVHHREILPQFSVESLYKIRSSNIAIGLTIFSIGLFKKVVLADGAALYATPLYAAADGGTPLEFYDAWLAALSYTVQLYFDFSGYSDMAIGIARMFGVKLPENFNSPYKSTSIIEFWRRWHITLSRFLRDYLYFSLGGNRKGECRRLINLMVTMLLGGLWHGAGWTFVIWGGLHGIFLVVNHWWLSYFGGIKTPKYIAWMITFIAVVMGWVVFRAETIDGALIIWKGMLGFQGVEFKVKHISEYMFVLTLVSLAIISPNTKQIVCAEVEIESTANKRHSYDFISDLSIFKGVILGFTIYLCFINMATISEFIYFNF